MHVTSRARTLRPPRPHRPARSRARTCRPRVRAGGNARARMRPLFLARDTRHVESISIAREVARGAAALAGITAWAGVLLILAG